MAKILELRCCDYDKDSTNTETTREWIHNTYQYIYEEDITDDALNKISDNELKELIDELDWLSWK